ncbi:MAG: hypothetical protein U0838_05300 [Chloroflexota bacterium]
MTTESVTGPAEDPWADAAATGSETPGLFRLVPGGLDDATEAMAGAMRAVQSTVQRAPDDGLIVGASIASGVAIGLLISGAPRVVTAGAVITAVSLGASLVQRHPRRYGMRARGLGQA